MLHRAQNLIAGRRVDAASGESFELHAEGTRTSLGRWPRSGARDAEAARLGLVAAASDWSRRTPAERLDRLWEAFERLDDDPDPDDRLARAWGLARHEVEDLFEPAGADLDAWLAAGGGAAATMDGPVAFLQDATESYGELARATFRALHAGAGVLVVSDPRAPMIADTLARVLEPVVDGAFALVHDDGRTVARAVAADPTFARISVASTYEGLDDLRARMPAPRERTIDAGFGAGLTCAVRAPLVVRALENAVVVVDERGDLERDARTIVDHAVARVGALSGLAPGAVGRVLCPRRVFSRFTEHLLAAVAAHPDVARPLGLVNRVAGDHLDRTFALGHDEGATAIYTGPAPAQRFPLVFTNVEEPMRLAHEGRPAPVLSLLRVLDVERGRALAARLETGTAGGNPFRTRGGGRGGASEAQSAGSKGR